MSNELKIGDNVKFYPTHRDRSLEPLMGFIFNEDTHNTYCPYKWKVRQFVLGRGKEKSRKGPDYHLMYSQIEKVPNPEFFLWSLTHGV